MENGGPFRGTQKPEKVIQFRLGDGGELINKWLANHVGTVDIISRKAVFYNGGGYFVILIWYRERG